VQQNKKPNKTQNKKDTATKSSPEQTIISTTTTRSRSARIGHNLLDDETKTAIVILTPITVTVPTPVPKEIKERKRHIPKQQVSQQQQNDNADIKDNSPAEPIKKRAKRSASNDATEVASRINLRPTTRDRHQQLQRRAQSSSLSGDRNAHSQPNVTMSSKKSPPNDLNGKRKKKSSSISATAKNGKVKLHTMNNILVNSPDIADKDQSPVVASKTTLSPIPNLNSTTRKQNNSKSPDKDENEDNVMMTTQPSLTDEEEKDIKSLTVPKIIEKLKTEFGVDAPKKLKKPEYVNFLRDEMLKAKQKAAEVAAAAVVKSVRKLRKR